MPKELPNEDRLAELMLPVSGSLMDLAESLPTSHTPLKQGERN
jgi:hypothetical protein